MATQTQTHAARTRPQASLRTGTVGARAAALARRGERAESYVQYAVVVTLALVVGAAVLSLAANFTQLFGRIGSGISGIGG